MKALIQNDKTCKLHDAMSDPVAQTDEVVVRINAAAVNANDFTDGQRAFEDAPEIPGRAFVGVVESVGDSAQDIAVGTRVTAHPSTWGGTCDMCRAGLRTHARDRTIIGVSQHQGTLAQRIALPARNLITIPEGVDDDHALFAEPVAQAIQVQRQLAISGKPYITVIGDTALALLTAQVLLPLNASVRLLAHQKATADLCERFQIRHRMLNEAGRRADQDVVVICDDDPQYLEIACQLVRPRGTIVLKCFPDTETSAVSLAPVIANELNVIGSWLGPVDESLGVLQRGEVDVLGLVTRRMKLDDGPAIAEAAQRDGAMTIIVDTK